MNEMTDQNFADLFLYCLATSLSFDQIAQNEIDNQTEEIEDAN